MKLVYLQAAWCGVCREKAPVVAALADELGLRLETLDHDVAAERETAAALRVTQPPTLALVDGARVRFRLVGRLIEPETVRRLVAMTGWEGQA
jgi:thiol-disulfide isomerase/thioredoxin